MDRNKGVAAESIMAYEDAYGAWCGKHVDSSARQSHFGSECSKWLDFEHPFIYEQNNRDSCNNELSYFHSPDLNFIMDECNTSNSNSSSERYMAQLVSCSTDPNVYIQPQLVYPQPQVYAPSARRNSSSTDCSMSRNGYSTLQHGNLCKVNDDFADYIVAKSKEPGINQYSEGMEGYMDWSIADNNTKRNNGTGDPSLMTTCSSSGNKAATGDLSIEKHLNSPTLPWIHQIGNELQCLDNIHLVLVK